MSSVRSATSATHRVASHAGPNPRAAGLSALSQPQRIAGSYPSLPPPGGLSPVYIATLALMYHRPAT